MRRSWRFVLGPIFLSLLTCTSLWAQATAEISGVARDQSGAVLPGVEITATQTETGISRSTVTNETGSYVLSNLAIGPYRLEASLPGFRTFVQSGIVLQVNGSPVVNVTLEIGQVSEQVEVEANAALVETRNSTVGAVIENQRIVDLPLNGRSITDLITLAGGAVQQATTSVNFIAGAPLLAVAGGLAWSGDYTLDGANHLEFMSLSTMSMPFPDATQEFKVETSGATASKASSTSVAVVTKSGTNEFHGDLFEFVRNDLFNAAPYFAGIDPATGRKSTGSLKRNQFGGTIGGPIVRNKLFFFGGYQGTTLRSDPANVEAFIPTPAMLAGDWTAFTSPACNAGRQITLRAPFVNSRIDPSLYSKPALYVVNWTGAGLPFPKTNDPCGRITYGNLSTQNNGTYVGKVDYQKSAKHSLLGRAMIYTVANPAPLSYDKNLLQTTRGDHGIQYSYAFGSTYLVSANTVQAFRMSVGRNVVRFDQLKLFTWCDAGVKIYCAPETQVLNGPSITGGFLIGAAGNFQKGHMYSSTIYSVNDDVSLLRGQHQFALGVTAWHGRDVALSTSIAATQTTFDGSVSGLGMADFLLGKPSVVILARTNPHHVNGSNLGVYVADTWKVKPKVTLNYGLRWEPSIPQYVEAIYNFDQTRFAQGFKSTVFRNAPAGLYYRGDPGFPKNAVNAEWLQFAPRLGLAWDVSGDGRTSVRASYGYTHVTPPGDYRLNFSTYVPWGGYTALDHPVGGLEDPWQGISGGNIFPYSLGPDTPFPPTAGTYLTQPYDLRRTASNSWNLSIQRQIGTGWLASGTYMGSNIIHSWTIAPINPSVFISGASCTLNGVAYNPCSSTANTQARRVLTLQNPTVGAAYGPMGQQEDGATVTYSGMLLSLERRAMKGITVTANYTLSHCIADNGNLYSPLGQKADTQSYTYPGNRRFDRGNCGADRRQVFNLTSVVATPQFSNRALHMVATGWRLSGIYRLSSGSPLNVIAGSDRALTNTSNQRPNQVLADPYLDRDAGPLSSYLNPAAFAIPALGTYGNVGAFSVVGPTTWGLDMALTRTFQVREAQKLEFRAEAFNITNSFRPGNPNVTLSSNTFGQIRTALDPRIMQFALKYVF